MGAAWRDMNGRKTNFKRILEMVKEIKWVASHLKVN
jgi:biotin synthase